MSLPIPGLTPVSLFTHGPDRALSVLVPLIGSPRGAVHNILMVLPRIHCSKWQMIARRCLRQLPLAFFSHSLFYFFKRVSLISSQLSVQTEAIAKDPVSTRKLNVHFLKRHAHSSPRSSKEREHVVFVVIECATSAMQSLNAALIDTARQWDICRELSLRTREIPSQPIWPFPWRPSPLLLHVSQVQDLLDPFFQINP